MLWENIHKSAEFDPTARAILAYGPERAAKRFRESMKPSASGCWELNLAPGLNGYSYISLYKKGHPGAQRFGHRVSALLHGLELNRGLVLDHRCRNRRCVNPAHLRQISRGENVLCGVSLSAINKLKTHCSGGHEFTKENTYVNKKGHRRCRICRLADGRAFWARRNNGG